MNVVKKRGVQYLIMVVVLSSTMVYLSILTKKKELAPDQQPTAQQRKAGKSGKKPAKASKPESSPSESSPTETSKAGKNTPKDKPPTAKTVVNKTSKETEATSTVKKMEPLQAGTQTTEEWYQALLEKYSTDAKEVPKHDDVVIRYYRKPKDGNKVSQLKKLGYYIHERSSNRTLRKYLTNTIYYGDSVKREDILLVAYQLRLSGVKLQAIEHSRFGDNWKSHSIELGTDTTMLNMPELSLDSIRNIVENNPFIKTKHIFE